MVRLIRRWVAAPSHNARYVERMEDVLAVYRRPLDPAAPLICFDESGKELAQARYPARPARPGTPARVDDQVVRRGSASLLLAVAPQLGWRQVTVTRRRTYREWALAMRELVDVHFPEAERVVVVLDNLNIHLLSALYHIFPPAEAFRIARKLELHYTPVHGSWLNLAEIEFSVLHRQCLAGRRFATPAELTAEVRAWVARRNAEQARITWTFTPEDARQTMAKCYPNTSSSV